MLALRFWSKTFLCKFEACSAQILTLLLIGIELRSTISSRKIVSNSFYSQVEYVNRLGSLVIYVRAKADLEHSLPSVLAAAEVHTPAQPLPESNATTIHNRWGKWAITQADGPGEAITSLSDLKSEYEKVPWKSFGMCKDNLVVNDCVTVQRVSITIIVDFKHEAICLFGFFHGPTTPGTARYCCFPLSVHGLYSKEM